MTTMDSRSIERRIADGWERLSEGERRLAHVVRHIRDDLSSFTASELAVRAKVSGATAARFFQRLGYTNYAEARRQSRDGRSWASPVSELAGAAAEPGRERTFAAHAAHDCRNLAETAQSLEETSVRVAVRILAEAKAVHVVGFRNSMALATYARALLSQVRPGVLLLPIAGMTMAEELVGFEKGAALLAIGFRRRPLLLRHVMTAARQAGLSIVLVADDSAIAAARLATVTLRCENGGHSMFDSYAAAISVINFVGSAVGLAAGQKALNRLQRIEDLHEKLGSSMRNGRPGAVRQKVDDPLAAVP